MATFRDRKQAGRRLAAELRVYAAEHPIILGLPRGGVPVAYEIARALSAPLDVWVVRKIGVPWQPELGAGAIAEGGFVHLNADIVESADISDIDLVDVIGKKRREVEERVRRFRGGRPGPVLRNRSVIVVDDGIATGGTIRAALQSIRAEHPSKIVLAVPIAASDAVAFLARQVDAIVALATPSDLHSIGAWYDDFEQVSDEDVERILRRAREATYPLPQFSGSKRAS